MRRAFKKGADKHHKDSSAYPDSHPGDKDAKTKLSKHTKKYRDMFGEGKNMKATKVAIDREKKLIAVRHDRMRDQARTSDTKIANRKEDIDHSAYMTVREYFLVVFICVGWEVGR